MKRFVNKTVFITGAGSGIGSEIALAFAREGATVFLNDLPVQSSIYELAKNIKQLGARCYLKLGDIADGAKAKEMFKDIDQLDVLVNNAGFLHEVEINKMDDKEWDRMIKVHLYGTFYCSREAIQIMERNNNGKIINISSDLGQIGCEKLVHYCAAKGGIISFTKALARELAPKGILVNSVAPGGTLTPLVEKLGKDYIRNEGNRYPLKRLAYPNEVAQVILFLASKESSFMTGQIIGVNGGGVMNG